MNERKLYKRLMIFAAISALVFAAGTATVSADNTCYTAYGPIGPGVHFASIVSPYGEEWFEYIAPASGVVTVSSCGYTFIDTKVYAYDECYTSYFAYNDDFCGLQSQISFPVTGGEDYYIKWMCYGSGTGAYNWLLTWSPPVAGDDCSLPINVNVPGDLDYYDYNQYTCGRTDDYDYPYTMMYNPGYYDSDEDIIYELNVASDTTIIVTMDPKTTTWAGVHLFDDCPDVGMVVAQQTYSDVGYMTVPLTFQADVYASQSPYYIMVDGWYSYTGFPYYIGGCIPDFDLSIVELLGNDVGVSDIVHPANADGPGMIFPEVEVKDYLGVGASNVDVDIDIYEGTAGGTVFFSDFEADNGGFSTSGSLNEWEWGSPSYGATSAYSGAYCWGTDLNSQYDPYSDSELTSPEIDLSSLTQADLDFYMWFDTESYFDGINLKISTDGVNFYVLGTYLNPYPEDAAYTGNAGIPGEPCWSGHIQGFWQLFNFNLDSYCGGSVWLRWHFGSDGSVQYPGAYVDDVHVYSTGAATPIYSYSTTGVSVAPGGTTTVYGTSWTPSSSGLYSVYACATNAIDLEPANDCMEALNLMIGDVDAGVTSIVVPHASMGPVPFTPKAEVTNFGDIDLPACPVRCQIDYAGSSNLVFEEDFEGSVLGATITDADMKHHFDPHVEADLDNPAHVGETKIDWETEPNLDMATWTVVDYDGVAWHQTNNRYLSPDTSMYHGDESTYTYPANSYDILISPRIHVGATGTMTFRFWMDIEGYYYDQFYFGNSDDGSSFSWWWFGPYPPSGGWWSVTVPLFPWQIDALGNTHIGFLFFSDSSVQYEGVYVDDLDVYGESIYNEVVTADVDAGATVEVTFPVFTPDQDKDYTVTICTEQDYDEDLSNDCDGLAFDTRARVWNTRNGYGFDMIQDAIDDPDTLPGDTIVAKDGESFYEHVSIYKDDLTVTAQRSPTATTIVYGTFDITGDGDTLQNFKIIPGGLYTTDEAAVFVSANDVTVQNNIIEGMTGEVADTMFTIKGVHVYGGGPGQFSNILIQNNTIRNIVNTNVTGGGGGAGPWNQIGHYILPESTPVPETWYWGLHDLSAYDGKKIQVAFRYVSDDQWAAYFDDIYVGDGFTTAHFEDFDAYSDGYDFDGTANCGFYTQENYGTDCYGTYHYAEVENYKSWSSPNSAEIYYNCPNDDWLITPTIDCSALTNGYLSFWYLWDDYWDIEFYVYVREVTTFVPTYGGADGIMVQGYLRNVDVLDNSITDIHSAGWSYGVEVTPTATRTFDGKRDTIFTDDFSTCPGTWSIYDIDGSGMTWGCSDFPVYSALWWMPAGAGGATGQAMLIDDDLWGPYPPAQYDELCSQSIDCSLYENCELDFNGVFQTYYGNAELKLEVYDGSWHTIQTWTSNVEFDTVPPIDISTWADGNSNFMVCFTHDDGNDWELGAVIDDVIVTGDLAGGPGPGGAAPQDVDVIGNYFFDIGSGTTYPVWDNPYDAPYPGVMFSLDETYPGANDGDAGEVALHLNIFENDCVIPILAVINKDTDEILMAQHNFWGNIKGPASYPGTPKAMDAITGKETLGDGFSCAVVNHGPVHWTPWIGLEAVASASDTMVESGEVVVFDGEGSWALDQEGNMMDIHYHWDFDDGTYSQEKMIGHVYDTPGTYKVSLRIMANGIPLHTNLMYEWDYITIHVVAPDAPLAANADGGNFGQYKAIIGEDVQLYGVATGGEEPYTYEWDLGNGYTSTLQNPTALYEFEGTYTVTLTVVDQRGWGDTATDTADVIVLERDEMLISIEVPSYGWVNTPISLDSEITGGIAPFTYLWDFGDGQSSDLPETLHTYEQVGLYTVSFTVSDSEGKTLTETAIISIEEEPDTEIEIGEIQGGLGLKTTIKAGDRPVDWTIQIDGIVIIGQSASGTIPANAIETVRIPFSLGIGNVEITVTANDISKHASAFMIGPFVLIR